MRGAGVNVQLRHGDRHVLRERSRGRPHPMSDPAYISRVRIERLGGPQRLAYIPAADEPVRFGVHSEVAEHYGADPEKYPPEPTTLDYIVAAAAG
jgi:hypothetical protein